MKRKQNITEFIFLLLILLLPVIYLALIYPSLPAIVPTHFDGVGKGNAFSPKRTLWYFVLMLITVSTGVYLLLSNIPSIDPKRSARRSTFNYHRIALAIACLLCASGIILIYSASNGITHRNTFIYTLFGLFFAYLGNMMHSIKPNYFVGIRVPWTLESEDNWRATHRLGSKVLFAGGIIITIGTLLSPPKVGAILMAVTTALIVLIPIIYSFLYYKKHRPKTY